MKSTLLNQMWRGLSNTPKFSFESWFLKKKSNEKMVQ